MAFVPTTLGTGTGGYAFLKRTRDAQQDLFARSPQVARETQRFLDRIADIQTADQLLDDRAMLRVALGAFGLDDDINNRAFLQKILESDLDDPKSMANRLSDKRYLALAETFNFAGKEGPSLARLSPVAAGADDLADIRSADALLNDRALLKTTLAAFGLERDMGNGYFLKQVLESDPADQMSFANLLSDPRYRDLARAVGLAEKAQQRGGMQGFAALLAARDAPVATAADLMEDPELYQATLGLFGLGRDAERTAFIQTVLESDPTDSASVANTQEDRRYLALAKAFGFVERAAAEADGDSFTSRVEAFAAAVSNHDAPIRSPRDFFGDVDLMLKSYALFDLPPRPDGAAFVSRILDSDRSSPTSLVNVYPDQRYRAFADAIDMQPESDERIYPEGFGAAIVGAYLDRQFEVRVGESDPTMRFALALERDLTQIVNLGTSNNAHWFSVMSSKPMREVFETVFQLPSSFGTLDIDRQLVELKDRSNRFFGTDRLADFTGPDKLEELRQRYLVRSQVGDGMSTAPGNLVLSLLQG
ncbi:DUF1217 domain-containing protein [Oceaniglobus trochenteri]|uniref:DUF1217 domain-containing protein n=1 Tax=Oceaniglobus trochenteri TaxID=2763260 RepID=UPI001CFF9211|nr:DUF1217 domain-containing protein [Oceaniglobus trochenteri]